MAAYIIVEVETTDEALMTEYRKHTPGAVAAPAPAPAGPVSARKQAQWHLRTAHSLPRDGTV